MAKAKPEEETVTHLASHIRAALACASKEKDRPHLAGVKVDPTFVEATDGQVLVRITREHAQGNFAGLVPAAALTPIINAEATESMKLGRVAIAVDEMGVETFRSAPIQYQTDMFPDTNRVVPDNWEKRTRVCLGIDLLSRLVKSAKAAGVLGLTFHVGEGKHDPVVATGTCDGQGAIRFLLAAMDLDPPSDESDTPQDAVSP